MIAIGHMVHPTHQAALRLKKEGVRACVINARFIKPLDCQLIAQMVLKTGRFLTVEDNALRGGFGSAILEMLQEQGISGYECKRLGLSDSFICHGSVKILRRACGLDEEGIYTAARVLMGKEKERPSPVFNMKAPFFSDIFASDFN